MRKISVSISLLFCVIAATAQTTYSKTVKEQIHRVETNLSGGLVIDGKPYTLAERMKHYNAQGVSIAVIDNYQIVWAKGYGFADTKENRKVTVNTLFEPGSISKSLNAVGILQLAQAGKLDLYQDINQYLTSWKFPYDTVSHGKKITTAQLLSHSAGLGVHGFPGYHRDSTVPSVPEILDGRAPANTESVRSVMEPGLSQRYSGGGILITQQMLTDLTKQSYEDYMYNSVFRPLGMTNSSYSQPPSGKYRKNLATGYKANGMEVAGKYFVYPEKSAAGLWTTPTDLCKYMIEIQRAYSGTSSKVLNQEMVKLHVTPYGNGDAGMGTYLQDRNGEKYFVHDASNEGFTGLFIAGLTNGKGVAIFVNSDDGYLMLELLNSVALVYNWKGFQEPEQITTVPVHDTVLSKYVGEYITEGTFSEVKKEKGGLYYWIQGTKSKMYFTTSTGFRNLEFPSAKSFTFDSSGTVSGFTRTVNGKVFAPGRRINNLDTIKANPGEFSRFGRHLLEGKNYENAIRFLNRGLIIEPADSLLIKDLAHSYLFAGNFQKAVELYQEYLKSGHDEADLKAVLKNDLDYFRKEGFDAGLIDKVRETLLLTPDKKI